MCPPRTASGRAWGVPAAATSRVREELRPPRGAPSPAPHPAVCRAPRPALAPCIHSEASSRSAALLQASLGHGPLRGWTEQKLLPRHDSAAFQAPRVQHLIQVALRSRSHPLRFAASEKNAARVFLARICCACVCTAVGIPGGGHPEGWASWGRGWASLGVGRASRGVGIPGGGHRGGRVCSTSAGVANKISRAAVRVHAWSVVRRVPGLRPHATAPWCQVCVCVCRCAHACLCACGIHILSGMCVLLSCVISTQILYMVLEGMYPYLYVCIRFRWEDRTLVIGFRKNPSFRDMF